MKMKVQRKKKQLKSWKNNKSSSTMKKKKKHYQQLLQMEWLWMLFKGQKLYTSDCSSRSCL